MKSSTILIVTFYALVMFLIGCSHGTSPIEPCDKEPTTPAPGGSRALLGLYTFIYEPDTGALDVIPQREVELHLNALKFLEPPPFLYLTLESPPQFNGNILDVDIGLTHPFLALPQFTGFDVCGIVFTHGSITGFNDPDIVMAGEGDTRLLNADGYTRWWNPAEFPHGDTIFNYKDGMLGTPADAADFNCTINGYKYFADGLGKNTPLTALDLAKRGMFSAGKKNIRHYTIEMSGGLIFNYAVDACWAIPQGDPPYNVPDDFPQKANRPEAWNLTITELESDLYYEESTGNAGGDLSLLLDVWDHFNASLNQVYGESLAGLPLAASLTPVGGGEGYSTYELDLTGENLTQNGEAELFITVRCEDSGYGGALPGKPVDAYFQHTFNILTYKPYDPCDPDLDPPDTFIDYGCEDQPPGTIEITLGVSGIDPNDCTLPEDLTYEWRKAVNDGQFSPWQTGDGPEIIITGLFHGNWAIEVRAVDLADNKDPTPEECLFYIPPDSDPEGWARTWGGPYMDFGCAVAVDNSGYIYCTGDFTDIVDFDPGPGIDEHTSSEGSRDVFLSKFNPNGEFQWARTWGGPGWEGERGYGVAVDDSGNVYITGRFQETVDFDPGSGIEERSSNWGYDVFISKFNSNGAFQWVCTWGAGYLDEGYGIAVDDSGGVYVTGILDSDAFLHKFNSNGEPQWECHWGGEGGGRGNAVTVVDSGYVYITGRFSDTVDFDPSPGIDEHTSSEGSRDVFLSKFNTSGDFQWACTWGGEDKDNGYAVASDDSGNAYVAGEFMLTVDFDPGPGTDQHSSYGGSDAFLSKFNSDGGLQWVHTWGGEGEDKGYGIAVDDSENLYITGTFTYTVDFDPGTGTDEHVEDGWVDAFLSKFDLNGTFLWARTWGGFQDWTSSMGVAVDDSKSIYVTGDFYGTVDFNPGPGIDEHTAYPETWDAFLMKILPDGYW